MIRKKRMGKGIAKILSGLLVFGMVAGLVPTVPGGTVHAKAEGESEPGVTAEQSEENVPHTHCECGTGELSAGGHTYHHTTQTWTGIDDLSKITKKGEYYLTKDITINSVWECPNSVELCLNGHSITRNTEAIDGSFGGNAVIRINENTSFALTDCQKTVGTITHAKGVSGEGVYNAGFFIMYNGKISGNNSSGVNAQSLFEMYDGMICNNKTSDLGGGVYVSDSGGYKYNFEMYGGEISDNEAKYGAGVFIQGTKVAMTGGTIYNNKSTYSGGGVYNGSGTFTMSDGTTISGNKAMCGGGVYKESGTFTMSGGTITGNTAAGSAANASGGGVYNKADAFTMSGGTMVLCQDLVQVKMRNFFPF